MKYNLKNFPQTFSHRRINEWLEGFEKELNSIHLRYDIEDPCRKKIFKLVEEILG